MESGRLNETLDNEELLSKSGMKSINQRKLLTKIFQ